MEAKLTSMEANSARVILITAIAPVVWGSTYYVTRHFLPSDYPLFGATIRALPAGLLLLLVTRTLPRGTWWLKTLLISTLTISGFFYLVYLAGSRLPSSIASVVMSLSPLVTIAAAVALGQESFNLRKVGASLLGIVGVLILIGGISGTLDFLGLLASITAMVGSALGFVLARQWKPPVGPVTFTAWQLTFGGLTLLPIALLVEGPIPVQPPSVYWGYLYLVFCSSMLAYICWFYGLSRLPASTVSLAGLLNPLAGILLGTLLANETLNGIQLIGCAFLLLSIVWGTHSAAPRRT